jgi:hypothetical protein
MEYAGLVYGYLVYFTDIWSILRIFGIFYDHVVYFVVIWYTYFPPFWYAAPRKIWQPCFRVLFLLTGSGDYLDQDYWSWCQKGGMILICATTKRKTKKKLRKLFHRMVSRPGTYVLIFKYFCRKIQRKKLAFFTQNNAKLCKILIITFFRRKLSKIAENCDHNIDPRSQSYDFPIYNWRCSRQARASF